MTGTLIGVLDGAYVPIGRLPDIVRDILSILPCTHSATLLRQIMTSQIGGETLIFDKKNRIDYYQVVQQKTVR